MIPVFEASPHVAYRLQDQIAAHMMASIRGRAKDPKMPKSRSAAHQQFMDRCKAERDAMTPKVRKMAEAGMNQTQIAAKIGASRGLVERIFSDAGIEAVNANVQKAREAAERRAALAPEIERMFRQGISKRGIGRDLGVSEFYVSRILSEAGERHTERTAA